MVWLPTLSELALKLAVVTPMLVLRAPLLIRVVPSKKLTVPLGEATTVLPGETTLTVAVKVVDWPNRVGLTEDVSAVMVSALLTTWVRATEVEGLKLGSLLYVTVMPWLPVLSVLVLKLALVTPPLSVDSVPVPSVFKPSAKVTLPVGLATAVLPGELTVMEAVKVTDWPDTEGLTELVSAGVVAAGLTVWLSEPLLVLKLLSPP